MIELKPENISPELKRTCRWVIWVLCDVQDGPKLRKSAKIPFDAKSGAPASHSDINSWTSFEVALAAHESNLKPIPPANVVAMHDTRGIGMVLGKPFWGKDFDKRIVDGVMDPEVEAELAELNTYAEVSQSGTGVHVIGHGEAPKEGHRKDNREIYSCNRYFVMTGNVIGGYAEIRRFTPAEVKAEFDKVKAGKQEFKPLNAKLAELMTSIDFPDKSEAVMSLLTQLAYQNCDPSFIDTEFRKSKLYLETHWQERWPRLGGPQITKAIEWVKNHPRRESSIITLDETGDDEVVMKPLRYAWEPVLPLGKLVHFGGASSQGKSPVTVDLIARVSRGSEFPNGAKNGFGRPRRSILFNIEDGLEDTILPRYYLAGGVRGMLRHIKGVKIANGESLRNGLVALDRDIHLICERARQIEDLGLVILDPVTNYLGKMDLNAEGDVRNILTPLAGLAEELDIVVITVGHLNKSEGKNPLQRMMGATAFSGVARSVYIFGPDQNSESPYRHVMSPLRGEMHDSLVYFTEVVKQQFDGGGEGKVVKVVWDGTTKQTGEDTTDTPVSKRQLSRAQEAGEDLKKFLLGGKRSAKDCVEYLRINGFDLEKLNASTVRKYAGAVTDYDRKKGVSMWYLPTSASLFEPSPEREKRSEELKKDDAPVY